MWNRLGPRWGVCVVIWSLVAVPGSANPPKPSNNGLTQGKQVDILFTGRLFGYFRLPRLQSIHDPVGDGGRKPWGFACPLNPPDSELSEWARDLVNELPANHRRKQLLLGMGDNFALYLPSRIFSDPPPAKGDADGFGQYGKEDYVWDWQAQQWIPSYGKKDKIPPGISEGLREGEGVVPTDNVACFLSYAGYDAIVPGQHDFHYGPERVRELARLLASMPAGKNSKYTPVQMLADNLYIKTSWKDDHKPIPDAEKRKLPFSVDDTVDDNGAKRPVKIKFPADRDEVLPWFFTVLERAPNQGAKSPPPSAYTPVVLGTDDHPDRFACGDPFRDPKCIPGNSTVPRVSLAEVKDDSARWEVNEFQQLQPGSYKVCVVQNNSDPQKGRPYCHRFTVVAPFLQFPVDPMPHGTRSVLPQGITTLQNPMPFFFKRVCPGDPEKKRCRDVAVFGVVDPDLPSQVGELNYAWQNFRQSGSGSPDKKMKTELATMDPAKALKQLVQFAKDCYEYGDAACKKKYTEPGSAVVQGGPDNNLFMVLLAQMSPGRAYPLEARLKGENHFDVLIAAASQEQFTRDEIRIVDATTAYDDTDRQWMTKGEKDSCPEDADSKTGEVPCTVPTFVAVPPEAWEPFWMHRPVRDLRVVQLPGGQVEYVTSSPGSSRRECSNAPGGAWWGCANRRLVAAAHDLLPPGARHHPEQDPNSCQSSAKPWPDEAEKKLRDLDHLILGSRRPPTDWLSDLRDPPRRQFVGATLWALLRNTHADVAMMQMRDFYFRSRLAGCMLSHLDDDLIAPAARASCAKICEPVWRCFQGPQALQKTLDVLLWKGDFLTVLPVRGSVLEKVLGDSDGYKKEEDSSLVTEDQRGRYLVYLGIRHDTDHDIYYVNDLQIDPNRIYTVVTTDYIALGDTGYPELNDPTVNHPPNPLYSKRKFEQISTVVCRAVTHDPAQCASDVTPKYYPDQLEAVKPLPETGQTWRYRFRDWLPFHPHSGADAPEKTGKGAANPKNKKHQVNPKDLQTTAMEQPHWEAEFNGSLGFKFLKNSRSESGLLANFAGVSEPKATTPRFHSWTIQQEGSALWAFRRVDLFETEDFDYQSTFTDTATGPRSASQPTNKMSDELGARWNVFRVRRKLPHLRLLTSFLWQTQAFPTVQSLSVESSSVPLRFDEGRDFLTLGRVGVGWYDRQSHIEAGLEGGDDISAVQQFEFFSPQGSLLGTCVPGVGPKSLANCVLGNPLILPSSRVRIGRATRRASGAFWGLRLALPLVNRLTASWEDQGDFFFRNHGVNTTDTRLDNLLISKLSFQFWPNLAFSPTYTMFAYKNQIAGSFLLQHEFGITMDYTFRLTNRRVRGTEFRNKQAAPGSQQ
jgi:5'-nucleotidase, C-terminal domain